MYANTFCAQRNKKLRLYSAISSLPCLSLPRIQESSTMHTHDAADAGGSVLTQNPDAVRLVYKQRTAHIVLKTVFLNMSADFYREDDLHFFCPALLIWTRIFRQWTKRDGLSMSERRFLHQQHHIYASCYSHERAARQRLTQKKINCWIKVILVFFVHKKCVMKRLHNITVEPLMSHGQL